MPGRITILLLLCCLSGCFFWGGYTTFSTNIDRRAHLKVAQQKLESGDFTGAIEEYEAHIEARLQSPGLSAGENPYFYKALIGDLYLKLDKPDDAKAAFLSAKEHNVDNEIVTDRLRQLARYHAQRGRFEDALALLKEYRNLDPLMFDYEIDRVHRQQIRIEDEKRSTAPKPQRSDSFSVDQTPAK